MSKYHRNNYQLRTNMKRKFRHVHYAASYFLNVECLCGKEGHNDHITFTNKPTEVTCPRCILLLKEKEK